MSPEPTIAILHYKVEGYAVFTSLFLQIIAEPGSDVYSVVFSLWTLYNRTQQVSDKNLNGNRGRVADTRHKAQVKINHVFL